MNILLGTSTLIVPSSSSSWSLFILSCFFIFRSFFTSSNLLLSFELEFLLLLFCSQLLEFIPWIEKLSMFFFWFESILSMLDEIYSEPSRFRIPFSCLLNKLFIKCRDTQQSCCCWAAPLFFVLPGFIWITIGASEWRWYLEPFESTNSI